MYLAKTIQFAAATLKVDGDSGRFSGYASVFGGVDSYGDTIVKGAFESTLRANGKPRMFYNHDWNMPVGKYTVAKEDEHGLYVEGELTPGNSLASDVHAGMKHGTIDGLSIGGFIKRGDYDETESGRVIRKWSNLVEVSPVVFPADSAAHIDPASVKAARMLDGVDEIETVRDFERFLRDAGGFSKAAAVALTARFKKVCVAGEPDEGPDAKQMQRVAEIVTRLSAVKL